MGRLDRFIGKLESALGRRKMRVGEATHDRPLEVEGQAEQESGDLKQSDKNLGER